MIIIKQDCVRTSFILKHYVPFPILWVNLFSYNNLSNFFPVKEMPINKQSCLYVYWSIIWWDKIVNFIISICYISNSLVIKICAMSRNLGSKKVNNSITVHNKQEHSTSLSRMTELRQYRRCLTTNYIVWFQSIFAPIFLI